MPPSPPKLSHQTWSLIKQTIISFAEGDDLSRGASIAFYVVTSIAPGLVIVIAVAGLLFGHEAAQGTITAELSGLIGGQNARFLQTLIQSASNKSSGILASVLGVLTLLVTTSGIFSEMRAALDQIWHVAPQETGLMRFIKARAATLALMAALGFLLVLSLVISSVLTALGVYLNADLPFGRLILGGLNFGVSFLLNSVLFAAIYKILPDATLRWRDVMVGGLVTAFLFEVGRLLIGVYIGTSHLASSYGAAGGLIVLLLWIYYSAQIFLLGAEFTKAYTGRDEAP